MEDNRIQKLIDAAQQLTEGNYQVEVPVTPGDQVGRLGQALQTLASALETRHQELTRLNQITTRINSGLLLDQILEEVYRDFQSLIPYDRIGLSLLEDNGNILRAVWAKSERGDNRLKSGYTAQMAGSSLQSILSTREPRILNNLADYLKERPDSESTRLILEDGYLSSLTCPLVANGVPVGFMFFSSLQLNTYAEVHVKIFQQIADQLSMIVEKGRLLTELSLKNERIEQQNEELRRLNYLKNVFLGMAVHDLRNPISNIQLVTDVMVNASEPPLTNEEQHDFLKDINQQTRFMADLISNILNIVEIEAGQIRLSKCQVVVAEFMEETFRRYHKLAEAKGIELVMGQLPEGEVQADPQRLRQILDNLVSNAIKYSPQKTMVWMRAACLENGWRFEVQDQGPGIAEKDRARLFQDFGRLSAKPTGGEKSTGLGLSIARRMVEAHGGQIGADSQHGHGTTFWFTLP